MKTYTFSVSDVPRLDLRLPLGDMRIVSGTPGMVEITLDGRESTLERMVVEQRGETIHLEPDRNQRIRWSSVDVVVRVGEAPDLHARLTSGTLDIETEVASLAVETASGDVSAGVVRGDVTIRSASGDIRVGDVAGRLDVAVASGDIEADVVGSADLKSASGDVTVREVRGEADVKTASGEITVGRFSGDRFEAKSMSGEVHLGVPAGRRYDVSFSSLSGEIRTDFPVQGNGSAGSPARLDIKTVSGDIRIRGV